ncbi:unnamed protein product [marine sediment metagenome]|uniref:Uncharacterized protein n=1 Tax=marine sediment metagenome TaxID=412755 RepID=X1M9J3_9ZZZZ
MENLYKVDEYSGKLPNPKSFPIQGATIYAFQDRPYTFSDGFILDLSVREGDKERLMAKAIKASPFSNLSGVITDAEKSPMLLSEPEFIYDSNYPAYIVFTPNGEPIAIQVKYYRYFRNRYPGCQFYSKGDKIGIIAIKVDNKVVGTSMPMFFEERTLTKIKEERQHCSTFNPNLLQASSLFLAGI